MSKAQRITAGLAALLVGTSLAACSGGGTRRYGERPTDQPVHVRYPHSKAAQWRRTVLQQMVQETLIDQYAKNNNITVTDAEITAREDQIKANFPTGSWDEMLKARGLTEADVRSALREQVILDKALAKDVKITPAQIKQYFDKNHASFDKPEQVTAQHILVPNLATGADGRRRSSSRTRELRGRSRRSTRPIPAARTKAANSARSGAARWCRRSTRSRSRRRSGKSARR